MAMPERAKPLVSDVILAAQYVTLKKTLRHVREEDGPSVSHAPRRAVTRSATTAASCVRSTRRQRANGARRRKERRSEIHADPGGDDMRSNEKTRDSLLADIAEGLARLDDSRKIDGTHYKAELWRVEVALFNEDGDVLAVGPLTHALRWIVENVHQTEDTTDISNAVSAHVQIREGKCFGPLCGHAHNEPTPE